jgi:hypothetical protein
MSADHPPTSAMEYRLRTKEAWEIPHPTKVEIKNISFEVGNSIPNLREEREEIPFKKRTLQHLILVF